MGYLEEANALKEKANELKSELSVSDIFRDSNGNKEHKIDIWFNNEIHKLREKYNLNHN